MDLRVKISFIASPMSVPIMLPFIVAVFQGWDGSIQRLVEGWAPVLVFVIPVSYLAVLIVGVPGFLLLKNMRALTIFNVCFFASIFPIVFMPLIMLLGGASYESLLSSRNVNGCLFVGLCAFIISLVFWLIAFGRIFRAYED